MCLLPGLLDGVSYLPYPSNLSNRPVGSRSSLVGHRTTPSNSRSILRVTSSAVGARSRSVSNVAGGLTSPSSLSITLISAPLRHTVMRIDFVYLRSGLTPEQLKLISSVESVSKFGVPYGPDTVAYASASLVNLHRPPPPKFKERPSVDGSSASVHPTSMLSRVFRTTICLSRGYPSLHWCPLLGGPLSPRHLQLMSQKLQHPILDSMSVLMSLFLATLHQRPPEEKKEQEVHPVEPIPLRAPSPSPTVETTCTAATKSELSAVAESLVHSATSGSRRPALPTLPPFSLSH